MKKTIALAFVILFQTEAAMAQGESYLPSKYQGFNSSWICNNYAIREGVVTKVVATTQNNGGEAVYIEMNGLDKVKYGGRIFPRDPETYGYTPLERSAYIALITRVKVKGCFNGGDVYALELSN